MREQDKVVPIKRNVPQRPAMPPLSTQKRKDMIKKINAITLKYVKLRLATLFNNIDEYFFDKTGRTVTGLDVKIVFEAMRELREKRDVVDESMRNAITQQFATLCSPATKVERPVFDENTLTLVDDAHLEKSVTIGNMANSVKEKSHRELLLLNIGLQSLIGHGEIRDDALPLSPQFLCNSFLEASKLIQMDLQTSLVLFKHFERIVARELPKLYRHVLDMMIEQQVVDSRFSQYFHRNTRSADDRPDDSKKPLNEAISRANAGSAAPADIPDVNLYDIIKDIATTPISFKLPVSIIKRGISNLSGSFNEGELVKHLAQEQEHTASLQAMGLVNIIPALVKAVLLQHRRDIAKPDEDTINLSSMFFDFVLKDKNQPERIRRLVSQLQIPVLKLTLTDKQFFSHKEHPARRLINMIAKAGFGISGSSDADNERLYAKLEAIVDAITSHKGDVDRKLFAAKAKELADFMARDEHRLKLIEKRFSESASGAAKLELNTQRVNELVASRLNDISAFGLPIRRFIDVELKQLMRQTLLRDGEQSVRWHSMIQLFNGFVSLCSNVMAETEDGALEKEFQIASSLILKNMEQEAVQSVAHEVIFANYALFKSAVMMDREKTLEAMRETSQPAALAGNRKFSIDIGNTTTEVSDEFLARAKALPIGQWMEIRRSASATDGERCKLIAKIDLVDRFVFIDAVGKKVAELNQREVAGALQTKTLVLLNSAPLVERALHCISNNLTKPADQLKTVDQLIA